MPLAVISQHRLNEVGTEERQGEEHGFLDQQDYIAARFWKRGRVRVHTLEMDSSSCSRIVGKFAQPKEVSYNSVTGVK